jgi:hypothetical protein
VRRGSKTLAAALAALLLAAGLLACGDDDDSGSTTATAERSTDTGSAAGGSAEDDANGGGSGSTGSGKSGQSDGGGSSDFVPERHEDSGGGSAQYKVKGGDNSVQEFGEEAGRSDLEAAATALHNFLDARAQGNWDAACEYMSEATIASFEELAARAKQPQDKSCGEILASLTNPAARPAMKAEAEKADVGSLRIEGDRSFLIYSGPQGTILAMPMADEGGEWKVASLTGTPLN